MRPLILLCVLLGGMQEVSAQLNVELIHQLVAHSKDEFSRQKTARNRQAITTANEEVNRGQMARLKERYREIHSRFTVVGTALQALGMGLQSAPVIEDIYNQQRRIIALAGNRPDLVQLAIATERDIVERAVQLGRYIAGLSVSIGDLNQLKASDRRVLFGHAVAELRTIAGASRGLAEAMARPARSGWEAGLFTDPGASDARIATRIVEGAK